MTSSSHNSDRKPERRRKPGATSTVGRVVLTTGKVIGTLLLICIITGAILACFAAVYIQQVIMPEAHLDGNFDMNQSSSIFYQDAVTREFVEHLTLHGAEDRVLVSFDALPKNLVNATVAIEDQRFWKHGGVDWKRTAGAVFYMFTGQDIQGGSTITQQLIKNFTQYDDVTVKRKILEIFRALEFDGAHSKEQILEWYLNYIYLGDNCYGVATAARNYFDKELSELTLAECASLVSITNNPSIYGPYSNLEVRDKDTGKLMTARDYNKERQEIVLYQMQKQGMISEAERDAAIAEELVFARGEDESRPSVIYNWYDEQLLSDVKRDLMAKFNYSETLASNMVNSGGLKIYACVDPTIQAQVEEIYANRENMDLISASGQRIQSAVVVLDAQGNVVGLAGALGEKSANLVLNRASGSKRQPGSSIKTLSVYAPALEMGLITPSSSFDDYPVQELSGVAWPSNSYGYYKGMADVRWSVEQSSNPVAVRIMQQVTPEAAYEFMTDRFRFTTLEPGREIRGKTFSDKDLSPLALGGLTDGVTVLEMAAAYACFPRGGEYVAPRTYSLVTDTEGNILLDNSQYQAQEAVKPTTAAYVNSLLRGVVRSGTGTAANFSDMTIAGKTGSTNSNNDRWFVGYTPYYTAAVWVGYDTPERIKPPTSANPAAVLWKLVMEPIHAGLENRDFPSGGEQTSASICKDSGKRATEACAADPRGGRVFSASFFPGDAPVENCDLHTMVEVCTADPIGESESLYHLAGEFCPREGLIPEGADATPTVKNVAVLDLNRTRIGGKSARDDAYLLAPVEAAGSCTVHTQEIEVTPTPTPPTEYDPGGFLIEDPATWPPVHLYPDFDPENPATWPVALPPSPVVSPSPNPGGEITTPLPPTPDVQPPPIEDEPYIPADG